MNLVMGIRQHGWFFIRSMISRLNWISWGFPTGLLQRCSHGSVEREIQNKWSLHMFFMYLFIYFITFGRIVVFIGYLIAGCCTFLWSSKHRKKTKITADWSNTSFTKCQHTFPSRPKLVLCYNQEEILPKQPKPN